MDLPKLQKLLTAKQANRGNVEITAAELVELVAASGTENPGLRKSAEALAGEPTLPVVLHFADFEQLVNAVTPRRPKPEAAPVAAPEPRPSK